jgi:hypothetical protein
MLLLTILLALEAIMLLSLKTDILHLLILLAKAIEQILLVMSKETCLDQEITIKNLILVEVRLHLSEEDLVPIEKVVIRVQVNIILNMIL